MEFQETVGILTGLCKKYVGLAHTDVAANLVEHSADADGRVHTSLKQNVCQHGSGSCLTVGAGHGDGAGIVIHDLSQKSGTGHHRDPLCFCCGKFFVVFMNGGGVYYQVNVVGDVFRPLTDGDARADML